MKNKSDIRVKTYFIGKNAVLCNNYHQTFRVDHYLIAENTFSIKSENFKHLKDYRFTVHVYQNGHAIVFSHIVL